MKPSTRPQYYRLRRLLEMLREGSRAGTRPNCTHFTRELKVSRRTVMRDLDFLRDEENAPIAYDESARGYKLTNATYALPPMRLTRQEVFSFSIARKLLQRFEGTPLELDMRSVLAKVAASLEGTVSLDVEGLTEQFTVISEDHVRIDPAVWQQVARAINRRERLRMEYQKFNGQTGTYLIEPYHLLAYHGNWYALACNVRAKKMETFALSRSRKIRATGEHFSLPPNFQPREFFRHAFGITQAEKPWKVRLLFAKEVATYINERVWHPSQRLRQRRDGSLEMILVTSGRKELTRWILSWTPHVRILAPPELQRRVFERMQQGLACLDDE